MQCEILRIKKAESRISGRITQRIATWKRLLTALVGAGVFSIPAPAVMAQTRNQEPVKVELVSSVKRTRPGEGFTVGVLFRIAKGWHIYWKFSGEAGLPPTIKWALPQGWSVGEINWPIPQMFTEAGPLTTYGYNDSVLLTADITPSNSASDSDVALTANVHWMVCHDECVPGKVDLVLKFPTAGDTAHTITSWTNLMPIDAVQDGWSSRVGVKPAANDSGFVHVTLRLSNAAVTPANVLDWFPASTQDYAVKGIDISKSEKAIIIRFVLQSYLGPVLSGTRLESLLLYHDLQGNRHGATVWVTIPSF